MPPSERRICCFIPGEEVPAEFGCKAAAEWEIWLGGKPDDFTDACEVHVGAMLTDAPVHHLYPIEDGRDVATARRTMEAYRNGERGRDLGELLDEIEREAHEQQQLRCVEDQLTAAATLSVVERVRPVAGRLAGTFRAALVHRCVVSKLDESCEACRRIIDLLGRDPVGECITCEGPCRAGDPTTVDGLTTAAHFLFDAVYARSAAPRLLDAARQSADDMHRAGGSRC